MYIYPKLHMPAVIFISAVLFHFPGSWALPGTKYFKHVFYEGEFFTFTNVTTKTTLHTLFKSLLGKWHQVFGNKLDIVPSLEKATSLQE